MRQTKLLAQQAFNRPRQVEHFRRRRWAPRRASRSTPVEIAEPQIVRDYIPGEFDEVQRSPTWIAVRRGICLTSDISLLVLLSPCFAVWFLYRAALNLKRPSR